MRSYRSDWPNFNGYNLGEIGDRGHRLMGALLVLRPKKLEAVLMLICAQSRLLAPKQLRCKGLGLYKVKNTMVGVTETRIMETAGLCHSVSHDIRTQPAALAPLSIRSRHEVSTTWSYFS